MREGTSTFLQVDLQSFFQTSGFGQRLDLEKIWEHFNSRETEILLDAIVYTVRGPEFDSSRFETKLKTVGYDIRVKNLVRDRKQKLNLGILITLECMQRINLFDKWILLSNNGAFVDVCKHLRESGKQVEIWSLHEGYDPSLEIYADKMHFLDDDFCLKKPDINVFGFNSGNIDPMMGMDK